MKLEILNNSNELFLELEHEKILLEKNQIIGVEDTEIKKKNLSPV